MSPPYLLLLVVLLAARTATAAKYNEVIVFGDSISDAGAFYKRANRTFPPAPPYYTGRFSNGPVWIELAARAVNAQLSDYAEGGATACTAASFPLPTANGSAPIPIPNSMERQVAAYLKSVGGSVRNGKRVHVVFIGANDVGSLLIKLASQKPGPAATKALVQSSATATVKCIISSIDALRKAGARHVVLVSPFNLGITPAIRASGPDAVALASNMTSAMVKLLVPATSSKGVVYYRLDALVDRVLRKPSVLPDLVDIVKPCCYDPAEGGLCTGRRGTVCGDVRRRGWWDSYHLTARVHAWLGGEAAKALLA